MGFLNATGVITYFQGKGFRIGDNLGMGTFAGVLCAVFVAVSFTPQEVTWDEKGLMSSRSGLPFEGSPEL